jgi:uncharacterized protein YcbX
LQMYIYPIKSCGGYSVTEWSVCSTGLLYDRRFSLLDDQNKLLNQKNCPKMNSIRIKKIDLQSNQLIVAASGMPDLYISLKGNNSNLKDNFIHCGRNLLGNPVSLAANNWFTAYLNIDCKLIMQPTEEATFSNKAHILLISENSVKELKQKVPMPNCKITNQIFRPNFVVGNVEPFAEHNWIGNEFQYQRVLFSVISNCERCQMICIDEDGNFGKEPLCTLSKQRINGKIVFGVYLSIVSHSNEKISIKI